MGQDISALNGAGKKNNKKNGKPKYEPPPEYKNLRLKGNKKKKNGNKNDLDLPKILPNTRCRLKFPILSTRKQGGIVDNT